jgi:hypothetical protein
LKKLGFGKGYKYPHDYPGHRVDQEYLPARFSGNRYYEPSGEGEEKDAPPDGGAFETPGGDGRGGTPGMMRGPGARLRAGRAAAGEAGQKAGQKASREAERRAATWA